MLVVVLYVRCLSGGVVFGAIIFLLTWPMWGAWGPWEMKVGGRHVSGKALPFGFNAVLHSHMHHLEGPMCPE